MLALIFPKGKSWGMKNYPFLFSIPLVSVLLFGKDLGKGCITVFSICSLEKSQGIRGIDPA